MGRTVARLGWTVLTAMVTIKGETDGDVFVTWVEHLLLSGL